MPQFSFGSGRLFGTPVGGGAPVQFGALQDVQIAFNGETKELFGQYQFPIDVARGKTKVEGKAKFAQLDPLLFNQVMFGLTTTAGEILTTTAPGEAATVPAVSTYTVTAANGSNFRTDLGVYYQTTGVQLLQVASGPTVGQYTVNSTTGVYTFAAADASAAIYLNYTYASSTTGKTMVQNNALMGNTPKFQAIFTEVYNGKSINLNLPSCVASKLSFPTAQDGYSMMDLDFEAFANAAGQVFTWTVTGG